MFKVTANYQVHKVSLKFPFLAQSSIILFRIPPYSCTSIDIKNCTTEKTFFVALLMAETRHQEIIMQILPRSIITFPLLRLPSFAWSPVLNVRACTKHYYRHQVIEPLSGCSVLHRWWQRTGVCSGVMCGWVWWTVLKLDLD